MFLDSHPACPLLPCVHYITMFTTSEQSHRLNDFAFFLPSSRHPRNSRAAPAMSRPRSLRLDTRVVEPQRDSGLAGTGRGRTAPDGPARVAAATGAYDGRNRLKTSRFRCRLRRSSWSRVRGGPAAPVFDAGRSEATDRPQPLRSPVSRPFRAKILAHTTVPATAARRWRSGDSSSVVANVFA